MRRLSRTIVASALMLGTLCMNGEAEKQDKSYRFVPGAGVCFCPSDHTSVVISSRTELEKFLDTAPCTSRGEGAEDRARAWSERCLLAVDTAGIDFETEALLFLFRFFSSGMIKGSVEIAAPEDGVLKVEIVPHRPDGPLTPDLGSRGVALAVDKSQVRTITTDDGRGNRLFLDVK